MNQDFVTIPGSMMITLWKTTSVPDKVVPLPISQFFAMDLLQVFSLVIFHASFVVFLWSAIALAICDPDFPLTPHSHALLFAVPCFSLAFIMTSFSAFVWDAAIMSIRQRDGKPSLRLSRMEFWHLQLAEPICVQDIESVKIDSYRGTIISVTLKTRKPVWLAYKSPANFRFTKRGQYKFKYYARLLYGIESATTIADTLLVLTGNAANKYAFLN